MSDLPVFEKKVSSNAREYRKKHRRALKSCEACRHDLFERDPAGSGLAEAADIILETLTGKTGWQHEMDLVKKRDFSF